MKWTAHQRIVVGLTAAVLGIVALGVSAIVRLNGIEVLSKLIATDSMPGLNYTTQIELLTYGETILIQNHILTNDPAEKHRIELEIGKYQVRLARSSAERDAACRLRFKVFNIELGEGLPS